MIRNITPEEPRRARYYWPVLGSIKPEKTVIILEDGHYWKPCLLVTGEALMTGFDREIDAVRWARGKGLEVLHKEF